MCIFYIGSLLKHRVLGPTPRVSDSVGPKHDPRICISGMSPGGADAVGPGTILESHCFSIYSLMSWLGFLETM